MRPALLHNSRPATRPPELPDDIFEEYDRPETVKTIAGALEGLGIVVEPVPADGRLPWSLESGRYDFAFNIAEGTGRRCRAAIPAAVCELLNIPVTGPDALTLAVTLDKSMARRIVSRDVPVAAAQRVESADDESGLAKLRYPVIVKPNDEGSSKGISEAAVAGNLAEATERSRWLRRIYDCPVLAEEFLPGTEVTVGIKGNGPEAAVLGMMEIAPVVHERQFIYSLEVKRNWRDRVRYYIPPRLSEDILTRLQELALSAYRVLGCRDIARLDFRLDAQGSPIFLECNSLPGLDPENSDIVFLAAPTRSYAELVQGIMLDATKRRGVRLCSRGEQARA
jgi:D-alanine-D-alanine ligase